MNLYEGMFILDPALASDWESAEAEIKRVFDRAGAEIVGHRNWDERKLAYQIGKFRRGLYILTYFRANPEKIASMERDVQLSEKVLRVLFLRREKMTDEDVQKSLAAEPPKAQKREDREGREGRERGDRDGRDRDRGDRGDRGDYRGDRDSRDRREPVGVGADVGDDLDSDSDSDMDDDS
ncbi:MAG: 30S ribosomal protein S6 [Phycisphaerales bacterium]|nr:30S ribosomal protein S6 [Phycisphaerales bacterium]MCB9856838.1 30S ribosomal protein S6 [Phycisphaerales bacterium]MCB9862035.1 30S ribosomal protein S6 [Phycisphaerales bacterium]